mgnify:CR=1 FL=1
MASTTSFIAASVTRQVREATGGVHEPNGVARAEDADRSPRTEEGQEHLLSSDSEQRIGNALHALSDALDREGARKIEEIVISELRPLLRDWIEEHMSDDYAAELMHTDESVPRAASSGRERLDGPQVEWDAAGGTVSNGKSTPLRPSPDNF